MSLLRPLLPVVAALAMAVGTLALPAAPVQAASSLPALLVTEINPDNGTHTFVDSGGVERTSTQDNFEFLEVANTTASAIDLADYALAYNGSVPLTLEAGTPHVVPARGSLVLWLDYQAGQADGFSAGSPNSALFDVSDFRDHYRVGAGVEVGRLTGQPGLANSGTRSLSIRRDGALVSQSAYTVTEHVGPDLSVHYSAPPSGQTEAGVFAAKQPPTPGALAAGQGVPQEPEEPGVPTQGPPPATDPELRAPILQVTEVAPDTSNLGGADAYEFVEVYNSSDAPVRFRDFTLNYLYIDANAVTTNEALWPSTPRDPVIEPGRTLVLWVKNAANEALTTADFNAEFGAHLTADDLVEVRSGGMANGGLRGIQVMTNSGHDISRTYYFNDAQTTATTAIQYAWNPADSADHLWVPEPRDGTTQTMTEIATPTPGFAATAQVPGGLVATPASTTAPVIEDLTGGPLLPQSEDLVLGFDVRDDHQVRTVELTIESNLGDRVTRRLRFESPDRYVYRIPAVDVYGKQWVDYTVEASDGTHTTTLGPVRVDLADGTPAPVRLNHADGDFLAGEAWLTATTDGDPAELGLSIDGVPVTDPVASLEAPPIFAFEATNTDAFFRNGVKVGDEVLTVFDEGFYARTETVASEVPVEAVVRGRELTVGIYAGTKARTDPDPNENNDDFSAMNPRLALPDGRVLSPVRCAGAAEGQAETVRPCPAPDGRIAFADASQVYFLATFEIPADAFDSVGHRWDTTVVADGDHTVVASAGDQSATRTLVVDNSAPEITTDLVDGATMRGSFAVDASAIDAGSGLESLVATLDGRTVELPHETSSVSLEPGEHVVVFTAVDLLGNTATRELRIVTPQERPTADLEAPEDGAEVQAGTVTLRATPSDPEGDVLDVELRRGFRRDVSDGVRAWRGSTHDASSVDREGAVLLSEEELAAVATADGLNAEATSPDLFPYQLFAVDVPADAGDDATARIHWSGSANAGARVVLHVLDTQADKWEKVDEHLTTGGRPTDFDLEAMVPVADHVRDGEITVLVQHSEGFTTPGQSQRGDAVAPYSAKGVTPRGAYDFTIGWESDTQYYNQNPDFYPHQQAIHRFVLEQRRNLDLQYLAHTGDIVNDWDQPAQWARANAAYRTLDEAGLPYGVLAGNHDVGHHRNDYGAYGQHFGDARFAGNPWFGGSHRNNRGHYDLVSADGIDLMVLSMGWGAGDEQIDWMNEVIAAHPERKVWINLHEFMLTTGGLGPIPQRIMDEVVRPNPNVFAVGSGHYHDAFTRTDEMDDDGDGVADRTVYSMLFDYQGLPEGGLGYLRLLHFDNDGEKIIVRTYSPSLDDFDAEDPTLDPIHQEFQIPYAASGLASVDKRLATDEFHVDLLATEPIAEFSEVASGTTLEAEWEVEPGEHGWYVVTSDPYGAVDHSPVHSFNAVAKAFTSTPTPVVTGDMSVGSVLTAVPGDWQPADPAVELSYQWSADGQPLTGEVAATLTLTAEHVGRVVSVEVTGRQPGYEPVTVASTAVGPVVATGATVPTTQPTTQPTPTPVPTVTPTSAPMEVVAGTPRVIGRARVGKRLTVDPGTWSPGSSMAYAWLSDGDLVPGATASSLVLGPELRRTRISVRVTGTLAGHSPAVRDSAASSKVSRGALKASRPRLRGRLVVGHWLRAAVDGWTDGTRLRYEWFADGDRIGAGRRVLLRPVRRGARITVEVTGRRAGYRNRTVSSVRSGPVRGR